MTAVGYVPGPDDGDNASARLRRVSEAAQCSTRALADAIAELARVLPALRFEMDGKPIPRKPPPADA